MSSPREVRPHLDRSTVEENFDVDDYEPHEAEEGESDLNIARATDISEEKMNDYLNEGYVPDDKFRDIRAVERDIVYDLTARPSLLSDAIIAGVDGGRGRVERVQLQYLSAVGVGYILPYTSPKKKDDEKLVRVWGGAYFVIDDRLLDEEKFQGENNESTEVTYDMVENDTTCIVAHNSDNSASSQRSSVNGQAQGQLAKLGDYTEIRALKEVIHELIDTDGYSRSLIIRDGPLFPTSSNLTSSNEGDVGYGIKQYIELLQKARDNDIGIVSLVKRVTSGNMFTEAMQEELSERGLDGYSQLKSDGALFHQLLDEGMRSKWMQGQFKGYTPEQGGSVGDSFNAYMSYFKSREKELWRVEIPKWMYSEFEEEAGELEDLIFTLLRDGTGPPRVIDLADRNAAIGPDQEAYFEKALDKTFDNKLYPPYTG